MLYRMMQEDPSLRNPLEVFNPDFLRRRGTLTLYEQKCPKSEIRATVREAYENAENLANQLFHVLRGADLQVRDLNTLENDLTQGNYHYQKLLWEHPLWQQYAAYVRQFPLHGKHLLNHFVSEINRAKGTLYGKFAGIEKGEQGEDRVAEYLELFRGKYIVLNNVLTYSRTCAHQQTSETDFCIVTEKGLVVCEVKNYGNEDQTLHISQDGRWRLLRRNGGSKVLSPSPAAQNSIHCREIECFLEEKGFRNIPLIPVVIIPNNKVMIQNEGTDYVIRTEALYNVLNRDPHPAVLDRPTMEAIAALFSTEEVEERYFDVTLLEEEAEDLLPVAHDILRICNLEAAWHRHLTDRVVEIVLKDLNAKLATCDRQNTLRWTMFFILSGLIVGETIRGTLMGGIEALVIFPLTFPLLWTLLCSFIGETKRFHLQGYYVPLLITFAVAGLIFCLLLGHEAEFMAGSLVLMDLGAIGMKIYLLIREKMAAHGF